MLVAKRGIQQSMNTRTKNEMEAMECVDLFGKRPDVSLTPKLTQLFAIVGTSLTTLRTWGEGQILGTQSRDAGIEQRRSLRDDILGKLRDISDVAKSMEEEGEVGMAKLYRYPRKPTCEALMLTAESFAERAQPMAANFVECGLAPSFVNDLQAKVAAFRAATSVKNGGKADLTAAIAGLKVAAAEGMKAIRSLRLLMRVHLRSAPALLGAWVLAARVERPAKNAANGENTAPARNEVESPSCRLGQNLADCQARGNSGEQQDAASTALSVRDDGNYSAVAPWKTNSAGPLSVTFFHPSPSTSNPTVSVSPPRTFTSTGEGAPVSFAKISAAAVTPVPQACVSSSTPRS